MLMQRILQNYLQAVALSFNPEDKPQCLACCNVRDAVSMLRGRSRHEMARKVEIYTAYHDF
jgi:hypothetical protein